MADSSCCISSLNGKLSRSRKSPLDADGQHADKDGDHGDGDQQFDQREAGPRPVSVAAAWLGISYLHQFTPYMFSIRPRQRRKCVDH